MKRPTDSEIPVGASRKHRESQLTPRDLDTVIRVLYGRKNSYGIRSKNRRYDSRTLDDAESRHGNVELSSNSLDLGACGREFDAIPQFADDLFGRMPFTSSHEMKPFMPLIRAERF